MAHHSQNPSIHNPELADRTTAQSLNPLICQNTADTLGSTVEMLRNLIHVAGTDTEVMLTSYFYELETIAAALDYESRQAGYLQTLQAQARNQANQ